MSAPPSSRQVEFRNAQIGVMVAVLRAAEPPALADALHKMLGGMPDFFAGDATILDFAELSPQPSRIDWSGLMSLFRRFQLQPIGVRNLSPELTAAARQFGLSILDAVNIGEQHSTNAMPAPAPAIAEPAPPPPPPPPASVNTLFIDRPLRSGQQVYARGGDVVLLAGTSHGSEVIADGSIHCYGPLRGRAIAGAQGNTGARIIATDFGPEIVSIAGIYKTFEQGLPESLAMRPASVRLMPVNGQQAEFKLAIEPVQLA